LRPASTFSDDFTVWCLEFVSVKCICNLVLDVSSCLMYIAIR
jgi:hypothetical protein